VVSDHIPLASVAALPGWTEMKKVESVASRISKEILKEVGKQLGVLPDDLGNIFLSVLSILIRTTVL